MSSTRVLLAPLLVAGSITGFAGAHELELLSLFGHSDPLAMAVSEDESHLFLASGCVIAKHELSATEPIVSVEQDRAVVDGSILDACCAGDDLLIAGGHAGFARIAWREEGMPVTIVERLEDGFCTSVAATEELLLAGFVTRTGPQLRAYSRAKGRPLHRLVLPGGIPFDLEARGDRAWVALGTEGLVEVLFSPGSPPRTTRGPLPAGVEVPAGGLSVEYVRDLALGSETLYAAADVAGLLRYDLRESPAVGRFIDTIPIHYGDAPAHVVRVSANGKRVAAATLRGPAQVADGAPFHALGAIGLDLEVGAIDRDAYTVSGQEELVIIEDEAGTHRELGRVALPRCGWRAVELGENRVYEQHLKLGTVIREVGEEGPGEQLFHARPIGTPLIDGGFGLTEPDLVLFGADSEGALVRGLLEVGEGDELQIAPWSKERRNVGLWVGAQWLEAEGKGEWFVAGRFEGWELFHLEPGDPPRLTSWLLPPPVDPEGNLGRTYFNSTAHGDLLLGMRSGSRFGLLGWSIETLTAAARETSPGEALEVAPLFQLRTHEGGDVAFAHCWRASVLKTTDGRTVAVVTAGRTLAGDDEGRSRALVVDLEAEGKPSVIHELTGDTSAGNASCVVTTRHRGGDFAFVGGIEGRVELWNLARPSPRRVGSWSAPPSAIDARRDAVLDLALVGDEGDRQLLIAATRLGLVRIDLCAPQVAELIAAEILPTPGWAAGLAVQRRDDHWRVLLGDQKGGARLYRWPGRNDD